MRPCLFLSFLGLLLFPALVPFSWAAEDAFYEPGEYQTALKQALNFSPRLRAERASLQALTEDIRTASLGPQAEIEFEMEELGLDGSSASDSEMTLLWAKTMEPSGLKNSRKAVASKALLEQKARVKGGLLQYLGEVSTAYFDVAGKKMELTLAQETLNLSKELLEVSRNRVKTGAAPGLEEERSEMEHDLARITKTRCENALNNAVVKLSTYLGTSPDEVKAREFQAPQTFAPLSNDAIENHPLLQAARLAIDTSKEEFTLTSFEGRTQLRTVAGFRHVGETSDSSFLVGLSVPLGTARRNRSSKAAVKWNIKRDEETLQNEKLALMRQRKEASIAVKTAKTEYLSIENLLLPSAERIFRSVKEGYLRGELKYTDLLVAKQSLVDVAKQRVAALITLRAALLDFDLANGGSASMKKAIEEVIR
jgi:cobalt-zinc-cadmium efflux system outer membrane protein